MTIPLLTTIHINKNMGTRDPVSVCSDCSLCPGYPHSDLDLLAE